mgnify:CR=1 FL=1
MHTGPSWRYTYYTELQTISTRDTTYGHRRVCFVFLCFFFFFVVVVFVVVCFGFCFFFFFKQKTAYEISA